MFWVSIVLKLNVYTVKTQIYSLYTITTLVNPENKPEPVELNSFIYYLQMRQRGTVYTERSVSINMGIKLIYLALASNHVTSR